MRLELGELVALFEAGIVIFPLAPGAAESRSESNCPESLTLIVLLVVVVVFALVTVRVASVETSLWDGDWRVPRVAPVILLDDATVVLVVDELWVLVLPIAVLVLDEVAEDGGLSNDGGGEELVVAPAPAKVPVVLPFPPEPV